MGYDFGLIVPADEATTEAHFKLYDLLEQEGYYLEGGGRSAHRPNEWIYTVNGETSYDPYEVLRIAKKIHPKARLM